MTTTLAAASPNFAFLAAYDERIVRVALLAEQAVFRDPLACLRHLRSLGEFLAQEVAAYAGHYGDAREGQADLLRRLRVQDLLPHNVAAMFHGIRRAGNDAAHEAKGDAREALHQLQMARRLAVWFHRSYGGASGFKAGPFVPPPDPSSEDAALREELETLRAALRARDEVIAAAKADAEAARSAKTDAERALSVAYDELDAALELAVETESQAAEAAAAWEAKLAARQSAAVEQSPKELNALRDQALAMATPEALELDEAATRQLIDEQLRLAGWETDTRRLTYSAGARPRKGVNQAISEWPIQGRNRADYVLFAGLKVVGIIEAKRQGKGASGAIGQAKRYARDIRPRGDERFLGPWGESRVPFLFASNGRPYLKQLKTESGIQFLDRRRAGNHPRAIADWYTPAELEQRLARDEETAEAKLATEPTDYLGLRDYQLQAIRSVEDAVRAGQREILLAMATGTGKTRTALGLIYRLVKSGRFHRVLFLVDRTSLGEQAHEAFQTVRLEQSQTLDQIYDVKGLGDLTPDDDTRLHVATVQSMVKRLLYPAAGDPPIPIGRYDCIIVDESHRGYTLDRELAESELTYRARVDEPGRTYLDYQSVYRRVIEHFDAVRIGLTATPALHTIEIFGKPVFLYSYRQAVIDGYLVDHEPSRTIQTALRQKGIHWAEGDELPMLDPKTGQLDLISAPDELDFDVSQFNKQVITEPFNRVVCQALAKEIDPEGDGKTLVFCATDAHADLVVRLLKEAFEAEYGRVDDDAVMKITGAADRPSQLIRHFKNERHPNVVVTVDLLTTGIDVPKIVNLVFIRRVKSRILYEQMIGRGTRLCPEIGKELFRIYDAVGVYESLAPMNTMKPVVTQVATTFVGLVSELQAIDEPEHTALVMDQLLARFHRKKTHLKGKFAEAFEDRAGMDAHGFEGLLRSRDITAIRAFFGAHPHVADLLDKVRRLGGGRIPVSSDLDELIAIVHAYQDHERPEDYLAGFKRLLDERANELPALTVVLQRPRDLTRADLKSLQLALDDLGYREIDLRTAHKDLGNGEIAASIIGFIRQQALGEALVPYAERVRRALTRVENAHAWNGRQRRWLKAIGEQMMKEVIVDREALDRGAFRTNGGYKRINRDFGGELDDVLLMLHGAVWDDVG